MGLGALIIVDILEVIPPLLLKKAVDVSVAGSNRPDVWAQLAVLALAYFAIAIGQGLCRYAWRMYLIRASLFAGRDLRQKYASHLFGLSASFFDKRSIGELMTLATSDIEAVRMALGAGLLTFADALFYFITVPIAMYLLSPELTLLAFLPLPVIPWLVARNEKAIHERFEKVQEAFGKLSSIAQESLNGIRITKGFAKEDAQLARFRKAGEEYVHLSLRLARVQTAFGPTMDFAMSMGMVVLLYVGGRELISPTAGSAALTLGTFVAFQRYIQKMVWPMAAIGMAINTYQRAISSSKRLQKIFSHKSDVPEDAEPQLPIDLALARTPNWKTPGRVEFRKLSFAFPETTDRVLKDISLVIEPGERVAFVGAIGSGKSALLSLLPRLYPVQPGMLLIDGVDINRWPIEELRKQVGFVSQEVFLFSETVIENIAYGIQSPQAASIEQATRLACVHEDIVGLVSSFGTRLGERGVNLSGGQKQRMSIARAIVKEPPILVLDDALSSVDVQTEEKILKGLRARPGRNTEIIAAHRISTIQDADRIVVLDLGQVRQIGTHRQLMEDRRGLYRCYHEQQLLRADLERYSEKLDAQVTT